LAVHLQAFELDTALSRLVPKQNFPKVRVAGFGAHAGELLMEVFDHIRRIARIGKGLKQGWIRHSTIVGQPRRSTPSGETCQRFQNVSEQ
jgi:hypothetical protein